MPAGSFDRTSSHLQSVESLLEAVRLQHRIRMTGGAAALA